jgi:hypothetical protein
MKNSTNITIAQLQNSVNKIFECQQNEVDLHLNQTRPNAEEVLLQHLAKALQLIDRSTD